MDPSLKRTLERQHYKIVGPNEHFGVKPCHWMRQKLLYGRACYKEEFYGIQTHRCMQMAPAINDCTHQCVFCWRTQGFEGRNDKWDEPEAVFEQLIEAQRLLISGYKGDERCDMKLWKEAQEPRQVAISLSGEPTMYPYLSDFIAICKKRGMTTFVVTNGTNPEAIEKMDNLPTQLYVTVAAPDKETYKSVCRPLVGDGWQRLNKTLELLPSLKSRTRTTIRHTLVEGYNFHPGDEKEVCAYAKLDEKAEPMFIEPKGYVFVGGSRMREGMGMNNMPSHDSIKSFGAGIGGILGYELALERKDSRVALLTKDKSLIKIQA